jgi:hypothetical protein
MYGYILAKALENQMNAINTLKSLASLLTRISQIVIEEKIAKEVSYQNKFII